MPDLTKATFGQQVLMHDLEFLCNTRFFVCVLSYYTLNVTLISFEYELKATLKWRGPGSRSFGTVIQWPLTARPARAPGAPHTGCQLGTRSKAFPKSTKHMWAGWANSRAPSRTLVWVKGSAPSPQCMLVGSGRSSQHRFHRPTTSTADVSSSPLYTVWVAAFPRGALRFARTSLEPINSFRPWPHWTPSPPRSLRLWPPWPCTAGPDGAGQPLLETHGGHVRLNVTTALKLIWHLWYRYLANKLSNTCS